MLLENKKYPDITKKVFVENFIKKAGVKPDSNPSAIFMAGLPGAGKTEFSKRLISILGSKAIRLDMDEIASEIKNYSPEIADQFREPASRLLNGIYDKVLKNHLEFIMDGTFGNKNAIKNIKRALDHGYAIKIVLILQDPKRAWRFTKAREKIEHRSISTDGFVASYFNIIKNINEIKPLIKNYDKITLDVITKNIGNAIDSWKENISDKDIDNIIKTNYNNKTLKDYIDDRRKTPKTNED